jgi:hypothetical protein
MSVQKSGVPMRFGEVIRAWQEEPAFCAAFNGWLAELPFAAFRWETPSLTAKTVGRTFECVAIDSPDLARAVDMATFARQFREAQGGTVTAFQNLGGDAVLVVPCPMGAEDAYGHLGAFVRKAPEAQRKELWRTVGEAMQRRVSSKPVWLSTAGGGVSWLHVRLDDRPKYYGYAPYREGR